MAIAKDFPCKCGHLAEKHYTNIATTRAICVTCVANLIHVGDETCLEFVPDNLKYLELKKKKQELLSE